MSSYPICKSCSFLAIDYYEEISNTFEDCLSEALIPESTFNLNGNSSGALTVDKSHRSPWKSAPVDEAFISCEANKVEESVADITKNSTLFPNQFKWNFSCDYVNSCKDFNEEEFLHEKDLSILRGKVLHGKFQFLDVPQIPLPLLRSKKKHSSLATLLELLPMMELDDLFDFNDTSFEDDSTFFNVESFEEINKFPKCDTQMHFEELDLPELIIEERSNCEKITNFQYDMKFKDVSETNEKSDNILKQAIPLLLESTFKTSEDFNESCNNYNRICTLNDPFNTETSLEVNSQLRLNLNKTQDFTASHDISTVDYAAVDTMIENVSRNEQGANDVCVLNNMFNQSQYINQCSTQQKFSVSRVCSATLDLDKCDGDMAYNKNTDINFENILVNLSDHSNLHGTERQSKEMNDIFKEFDDQEKSCAVPIETFTQFDFHQYSNVQEDQTKIEENPILNSNMIASYKEKLSNMQYQSNINMKNIVQSGVTQRKTSLAKANDLKQCTAFRSQVSPFETANKNLQENANKIGSKIFNLSQPVDLLSNFIQVQFPFQKSNNELDKTSLKAPSKSPLNHQLQSSTLVSRLQVKEGEPCEKDGLESVSKHFQEENIPMHVRLEIEDVHVELPKDYVKILLSLEETSIPVLQSLILSHQFKFPAHLTLADIPPYKTCFLLNQEVKRCQDKHINKGNMGDYYNNLLLLHGILKTVECLIHFDIHLALSSLHTYDKTHKSFIKRFYEKLIEKLEHEIDECFENNSVHPKVKELSQYLCEKYIFCKENHLKFKVLIILKKNLEVVYAAFERVLRQDACNFRIYLIPESVLLHPNTLIFEGKEDTVYFINASSLSNNIPWTELSFVIEFEPDNKSCWKQICCEQNIAHAFLKVVQLPLKSLKDIQNLKVPEKAIANPVVENVKLLIVSASITSQYQLLYLLESRFHYSICIRQYKDVLPHLHFADIVVDEKSALILVSEVSFSLQDFSETLSERVSFLHIKFEMCWIIIQKYIDIKNPDASKCMKTNKNFHKFYLSMVNLCCRNQSYKIKILFAKNVDETTELIKDISSISLRSKEGAYVNFSIPSQITKEEIFLCSFPSLNPFVVNLMLFENNISELLNLTAEEMCTKFYSVPQRFLHCFYSTHHKLYALPSPEKCKEQSDFSENSSYGSSTGSNPKFQLKPNFPMLANCSQNYNNSTMITYEQEDEHDMMIPSQLPEYTTEIAFDNGKINLSHSQEKSLQELDLDYMSLKICKKFEEYQSSYDDEDDTPPQNKVSNSINMCNYASKGNHPSCSPFTFETLSSQISNKSYLDLDSNVEFDDNIENTYNQLLKVRSKSGFVSNINLEHEVPRSHFYTKFNCNDGNSPRNTNKPALNFNQFLYNPNNKRKLSTNGDSSSPVSKKSCRIQKGMASKTVSKRDSIYKSPFDNQEMLPSPSPNRKKAKVFPFMIRKNCHESSQNGKSKTSALIGGVNIFENHQFSQWSDSDPIRSFPLTPRVNRRLGFEGVSGQTKLVFQ